MQIKINNDLIVFRIVIDRHTFILGSELFVSGGINPMKSQLAIAMGICMHGAPAASKVGSYSVIFPKCQDGAGVAI